MRQLWSAMLMLGMLTASVRGEDARTLAVPEAEQSPVVDGVLDDAAWHDAPAVTGLRVLGSTKDTPSVTAFRVTRDASHLYVGVDCEGGKAKLTPEHQGRTTSAGRDDSVEVFLAPKAGAGDYFHFVLSAGGAYYEQSVQGRTRDKAWSTSWQHAVKLLDDRWTAEIAIPLYILGTGTRHTAPGFNLCRNVAAPERVFTTWAPLGQKYHEPESFGRLEGMDGISVDPVLDPRIREAVADYLTVKDGSFFCHVRADIANRGGVGGNVDVEFEDRPANGSDSRHRRAAKMPPMGSIETAWDLPIAGLGGRALRIRVSGGMADAEWITVQGTDTLRPISVFMDRNLYTTETKADLVCRAIFTAAQAEATGYRYDITVKDGGGEKVFYQTLDSPARESTVRIPLDDLEPGRYEAKVRLLDRDDSTLATVNTTLERRSPGPSTEAKFDQRKEVILVNGDPFFPFGFMYCNALTDERLIKKLADAGFNTIVRWGGVSGGNDTEEKLETARHGLDAAHRHGIRVFEAALAFGPRLRYGMDDLDTRFEKTLEGMERALELWRTHPAVIGYYGLDEPGKKLFPLARKMYDLCHRLDPYRLTYSSSWNDWPPEGYEIFDLLGRHGYYMPINLKTGTLNKLSRRCAAMAELASHFHRPFVATPQFCWREEIRKITPHEMRCCYYLPLIRGAKGLIFFIYREQTCHPAEWAAMQDIAAEISQLVPLLLEPSPPQTVTCDVTAEEEAAMLPPGPAGIYTDFKPIVQKSSTLVLPVIQTVIKNHPDGGEVILAANSEALDRDVTFKLSSIGPDTKVVDFFTGQPVELKGDTFQDRMNGYDVRVFRTLNSTRRSAEDVVTMAIQAPAIQTEERTEVLTHLIQAPVGGFEGDGLASSWSVSGHIDPTLSKENPQAGQSCLSVNLSAEGGGSIGIPEIELKKTTRYRLSGWLRSRMTQGRGKADLLLLVPRQFKTPPRFSLSIPQNQEEWMQVSRTFTTKEAVTASLSVRFPQGAGSVQVDNIELMELGALERDDNKIMNASFEEATYFGKPDAWFVQGWTEDRAVTRGMSERLVQGDAVHGEFAAVSGNWLGRYPNGDYCQFRTVGRIDFRNDHVFSIYLKTDREDIPVKFIFREEGWNIKDRVLHEKVFSVGPAWQRYVMELPLSGNSRSGMRDYTILIKCGARCNIRGDAAQLEEGLTPTEFKPDDYRAVNIGDDYQREAVLERQP